mmetsp:Transcript_4513/g.19233  ORF Transcript_4513/g.19233 Transcript_4513/m.19233 type:complete len:309 (-) Transcript_4513:159-1085(-)
MLHRQRHLRHRVAVAAERVFAEELERDGRVAVKGDMLVSERLVEQIRHAVGPKPDRRRSPSIVPLRSDAVRLHAVQRDANVRRGRRRKRATQARHTGPGAHARRVRRRAASLVVEQQVASAVVAVAVLHFAQQTQIIKREALRPRDGVVGERGEERRARRRSAFVQRLRQEPIPLGEHDLDRGSGRRHRRRDREAERCVAQRAGKSNARGENETRCRERERERDRNRDPIRARPERSPGRNRVDALRGQIATRSEEGHLVLHREEQGQHGGHDDGDARRTPSFRARGPYRPLDAEQPRPRDWREGREG